MQLGQGRAAGQGLHQGDRQRRFPLGIEPRAEPRQRLLAEGRTVVGLDNLNDYYDPMYGYQLEKKAEKIVYRGTFENVAEWLDR